MSSVKVAFLYSEIAGYFLANVRELAKSAEVLIFRWPVNDEAPFHFEEIENVRILDRSRYSQQELEAELIAFDPAILVCSGWMDKGYVNAARAFRKKIAVVLSLDNHWTGGLKQQLAALVSPFYLKRIFTHAWVPGTPQAIFANKLGFRNEQLMLNFYCADNELFNKAYVETFPKKELHFPKRFLFVARYVQHKGIFEMWEAFRQLKKEENIDWELWCIGTGSEWENRVEFEGIRHIGFVQPNEISKYLGETGVYILPSKFEPWGVTVQEFAISGFPLLLSDEIGAKSKYLKTNGFSFSAGSIESIKEAMRKIIGSSENDLVEMAKRSHDIGTSFTNKNWVETLYAILK